MQIKIIGQEHTGRGIARIDGKVIFIEDALPEEECIIEIIKENKGFSEAKVIKKLVNKSVDVLCPYYGICGGCNLMHQSYEGQAKFKEEEVKNLLHKFAKVDINVLPIISGPSLHYRNKIVFHDLGLYKRKSHDVVKIKECLLVDERINEIIKRLINHFNNIEEVMIRSSNMDEVLVSIKGNVDKKLLLEEFKDITCLILNDEVLSDNNTIVDKIGNFWFKLSKDSFYQVNRFMIEKLYEEVIRGFKNQNINKVLDLYCGVGTLSLLVSPYVEHVTGIEIVPSAIINANENKKLNQVSNVDFICGKVEDYIEEFSDIDAVIVDPPRSGLDNKTISHLMKIKPKMIVYVSCDPVTLSRDIGMLSEKYELKEVQPVDMFPNTHHVECVCVLELKKY